MTSSKQRFQYSIDIKNRNPLDLEWLKGFKSPKLTITTEKSSQKDETKSSSQKTKLSLMISKIMHGSNSFVEDTPKAANKGGYLSPSLTVMSMNQSNRFPKQPFEHIRPSTVGILTPLNVNTPFNHYGFSSSGTSTSKVRKGTRIIFKTPKADENNPMPFRRLTKIEALALYRSK